MERITALGLGRLFAILLVVLLFFILIGVVTFTKTILLVCFILVALALLL